MMYGIVEIAWALARNNDKTKQRSKNDQQHHAARPEPAAHSVSRVSEIDCDTLYRRAEDSVMSSRHFSMLRDHVYSYAP